MDILIHGMEMPTSCATCKLFGEYGCPFVGAVAYALTRGKRHKDCPLIPVQPHGDLIDRDKMKESIRMQTAFLRLVGGKFAEIAETLEKGFLQEIDNAPTVIPAEEDEI